MKYIKLVCVFSFLLLGMTITASAQRAYNSKYADRYTDVKRTYQRQNPRAIYRQPVRRGYYDRKGNRNWRSRQYYNNRSRNYRQSNVYGGRSCRVNNVRRVNNSRVYY